MSMFMLIAAPDKAEPIANARMNMMRTGFWPKVWTRLPTKGSTAEEATA